MAEIDPNVIELVRGFLEQDEVIERLRGDEDEHEALLDLVPVAELHPHRVHVKPTYEDEDTSYYDHPPEFDADGVPILHARTTRVRRQVVTQCPDCGKGLTSRGPDMICPRLPRSIELKDDPDHEGCVAACGLKVVMTNG